jgi:hypothetical protein
MAPEPTEPVVLRTFSSLTAAESAAATLTAHGIQCWIKTDDCGGMLPSLTAPGGVRLLAGSLDVEAAKALLDSRPTAEEVVALDEAASATSPPDSAPHVRLSLWQITAGIVVGILLCLLYQWTANLGIKTYRYDLDGDGKTDEVAVFQNGRCIEQSFDRNFDGLLDSWNYFDGALRRTVSKEDNNFDGVADLTWNYSNGLPVSSSMDTDFNGRPDVTTLFLYDLPKQTDWQPNSTNIVTRREFFRNGVLFEEWLDTNMDGLFDSTNQFDAFQNPLGTNAFRLFSPPPK